MLMDLLTCQIILFFLIAMDPKQLSHFPHPPPDYPAPPPPIVWEPFDKVTDTNNIPIVDKQQITSKLRDKHVVPVWVRAVKPNRLLFFSPPFPCDTLCLEGILLSYLDSSSVQITPNAFFYLEFPSGPDIKLSTTSDISEIIHKYKIGEPLKQSCRIAYKEITSDISKEEVIQFLMYLLLNINIKLILKF